jgi:hypothetical protein
MGAMFGLLGVGFLAIYVGIALSANTHNGGDVTGTSGVVVFIGIVLVAIGGIGSAALSAHRRSRERAASAREKRELARR